MTKQWDKTFVLSDKVLCEQVSFHNRYGIHLVGDLYMPKEANFPLAGLAVCGPFGACKEQVSGYYAMKMAERGFATLAFDPSFTGESGGQPRYMASPDINTEDFQAAVDFLSLHEKIDSEKIGIIGICGWGGLALNAAALDTRIKVTVTSTMYDMSRVNANGYFDVDDSEEARYAKKQGLNAQRLIDYKNQTYALAGGVAEVLPEDAPVFVKDYHAYYKTKRGYHPRSLNSNQGWNIIGCMSYMNQPILMYSHEIRSAVLMLHGTQAHSLYFSQDAYKHMMDRNPNPENKELYLVEGANHTDLYDGGNHDYIPFDKVEMFIREHLR